MNYILTTSNLTKTYGAVHAAENIDIHIRKGEIYGLIGRNGAGKTTIMRMLSGLSTPSSGSFSFERQGKGGIGVGALIEAPGLYPKLSAYDNLKIKCIGLGVHKEDRDAYIRELLTLVGLQDTGKKPTRSFSLGMRQRLGVALALVGDPEMIILDEPINGLDPQGIAEVRRMLERLKEEKDITIMVSSHILDELSKIADSYGIIHEGRLLDEFTAEDLMKRCGEFVTVKADDLPSAERILREMGFEKISFDHNNDLRVDEATDRTREMIAALAKADVGLRELYVTRLSLEDFYLNMTGGAGNA